MSQHGVETLSGPVCRAGPVVPQRRHAWRCLVVGQDVPQHLPRAVAYAHMEDRADSGATEGPTEPPAAGRAHEAWDFWEVAPGLRVTGS